MTHLPCSVLSLSPCADLDQDRPNVSLGESWQKQNRPRRTGGGVREAGPDHGAFWGGLPRFTRGTINGLGN